MEVLIERLILDLVPPDTNAQPHASATEHIHLRRLFRDKDGLALWHDNDASDQFESGRQRGKVAEEYEWLVKHGLAGIGSAPVGAILYAGANDMVVDEEMIEAHLLDRHDVLTNNARIAADLRLWKHRADT